MWCPMLMMLVHQVCRLQLWRGAGLGGLVGEALGEAFGEALKALNEAMRP